MAGRPLRRARALTAMNNPLTGWEDTSGMTAGTALQMLVPLVKPGARETFEHGYRNVPVPIAVALRPYAWGSNGVFAGEDRARQGMAERAEDLALANKLNSLLIVMPIDERNAAGKIYRASGKRGSVNRISPFTVFVILHRLGDKLKNQQFDRISNVLPRDPEALRLLMELQRAENDLYDSLYAFEDEELRAVTRPVEDLAETVIYSRGVDTAAGRLGAAGGDYMSDLFAKYLLTGKVAYDPVNPPPIYPGEAKFRQTVARVALPLFQRYVHILNSSIPRVIYDRLR